MIVKMKKITLLCVESERTAALERLRELGIMHVCHETRVESKRITVSEQELGAITKVYNILAGRKSDSREKSALSGEAVFRQAQEIIAQQDALVKEEDEVARDIETLLPWGDFDPAGAARLASDGVQVLFCKTYRNLYDELSLPEDAARVVISEKNKEICFVLFFLKEQDASQYPVVALPEKRLSDLYTYLSLYISPYGSP